MVERLAGNEWDRVHLVGAGSSYFVGLAGQYASEEWCGLPAQALPVYDFLHYALKAAGRRSLVIAVSQSGETAETIAAAEAALGLGLRTIALTNDGESRLGRLCPEIILTKAGAESGPGTKTVTAQCLAMYQFFLYLAVRLQPVREAEIEAQLAELEDAPNLAGAMLAGETAAACEDLAESLVAERELDLIGAGPFAALALQTANYLREVGKLHCCPFEACEFRHGPLEALGDDSRLLVLSGGGAARGAGQIARACAAAARAGAVLSYAGSPEGRPDAAFRDSLLLPGASEFLAAQLYLVPLHLVGYCLAKKKGLDPNTFHNIVKTWRE